MLSIRYFFRNGEVGLEVGLKPRNYCGAYSFLNILVYLNQN